MTLERITNVVLFVVALVVAFFGIWACGEVGQNWRDHDEKVGRIRREAGVTNPWTPVRK